MTGITRGNLACLHADTSDGAFANPVAQMTSLSASLDQAVVATTTMCAATVSTMVDGIEKVTYTATGFWDDAGDTTGQTIIMDNAVRGSTLWFKFLYDGTKYVKSQVEIESLDIKTTPQSTVDISISAQSTGTMSFG